ncbi:MAG: hypothetical protein WCA10_00380 [Terracidiphilus sp.]
MLRTFRYCFRPFNCLSFIRLAAIAVISEGVLINSRFWIPDVFSFNVPHFDFTTLLSPETIFFTILEAVLIISLFFIVSYVFVHLRFVFFHCVVHETKQIEPVWELYRISAMRFFRAALLFWLTVVGLTAVVLCGFISVAISVFKLRTPEGKFDPGVFLVTFLPCMGFALMVCLGAALAHVVMVDFILPHMALEELTFKEAWTAVKIRIRGNGETFFSYFILRLGLPLMLWIIAALAIWFLGQMIFGFIEMFAVAINSMLEDATGALVVCRITIEILIELSAFGLGVLISLGLGGPLATWIRNYALLFYAGHYRPLANILSASPNDR